MMPLTRAEVDELAATLRRLLDAIDADELTASAATRHRLEGALTALDVVAGKRSTLLDALTEELPPAPD